MSDDKNKRGRPPRPAPAPRKDGGDNDPTFALMPDRAVDLLRRFNTRADTLFGDDEDGDDPIIVSRDDEKPLAGPRRQPTPRGAAPAASEAPPTRAIDPARARAMLAEFSVGGSDFELDARDSEPLEDTSDPHERPTGTWDAVEDEPPASERVARRRQQTPRMETTTATFQPSLLNRYNHDEMDRVSTRLTPDGPSIDEPRPGTAWDSTPGTGSTDRTGPLQDDPSDPLQTASDWGRSETSQRAGAPPAGGRDSGDSPAVGDQSGSRAGMNARPRRRRAASQGQRTVASDLALEALLRSYLEDE